MPTPTPTPPSSPPGEEAPPGASQPTAAAAAAAAVDDDDDGGGGGGGGGGDDDDDDDALPPPPDARARRLDAAGLRQIRGSQQPAVVRFDRAGCAGCAALAPFWEQHVAPSLPPGSAWWADCD